MASAYIVGAVRTAGGRNKGRLSGVHPAEHPTVISMGPTGAFVWAAALDADTENPIPAAMARPAVRNTVLLP